MKISVGQPPVQLAIRTKPEHAQDLMDHLLEKFALQVETATDIEEGSQEHEQENAAASTVNSDFSKSRFYSLFFFTCNSLGCKMM